MVNEGLGFEFLGVCSREFERKQPKEEILATCEVGQDHSHKRL